MAEWKSMRWGDLVELQYGRALRDYSSTPASVRVYGSNGPIGWTNAPALGHGPAVVLGRKGAYRGVEYARGPFFVIDTAYYLKPQYDVDIRWLYYAVRHHRLGEIDDGSPIPSTTRAAVYVRYVEVPPVDEQRGIARILGGLDDKVELNRCMNETLEAMARALFKSWFVDFDPVRAKMRGKAPAGMDAATAALFPSRLVATEHGEIPEGWTHRSLKDLTTKIGSGATPRGGSSVYVDVGTAFIRSQNVYDGQFEWAGLARISADATADLDGVTVLHGDVLMNITGASFLRTCVAPAVVLPARVNQHVAIVRAAAGVPSSYIHQFLLRPETKALLAGLDAGASRQAVTKAHIESLQLIDPDVAVRDAFGRVVGALYALVESRSAENLTLCQLRDTLLPKLLSGELRVPEAERAVAEVA